MMTTLDAQVAQAERLTARRANIEVLFVDYDQVLADPKAQSAQIADFLGGGLAVDAMVAAVDESLRRQK